MDQADEALQSQEREAEIQDQEEDVEEEEEATRPVDRCACRSLGNDVGILADLRFPQRAPLSWRAILSFLCSYTFMPHTQLALAPRLSNQVAAAEFGFVALFTIPGSAFHNRVLVSLTHMPRKQVAAAQQFSCDDPAAHRSLSCANVQGGSTARWHEGPFFAGTLIGALFMIICQARRKESVVVVSGVQLESLLSFRTRS